MVIYSKTGEKLFVEIPDTPIRYVMVAILSGDETGIVAFENYSTIYFDSNPDRKVDDFQSSYIIDRERVKDWMNFVPVNEKEAAHERAIAFGAEEV